LRWKLLRDDPDDDSDAIDDRRATPETAPPS
jgi:hypothetical protein